MRHPPASAHTFSPRGSSRGSLFVAGRACVRGDWAGSAGSVSASCGARRPACPFNCTGHVFEPASNGVRSRRRAAPASARSSSGVCARAASVSPAILPAKCVASKPAGGDGARWTNGAAS